MSLRRGDVHNENLWTISLSWTFQILSKIAIDFLLILSLCMWNFTIKCTTNV